MKSVALNKSALHNEMKTLQNLQRFQPALEFKREQLMIKKRTVEKALQKKRQVLVDTIERTQNELPMLARTEPDKLSRILFIKDVKMEKENFLGLTLPVSIMVTFNEPDYDYFTTPHWLEFFIDLQKKAIRLRLDLDVLSKRIVILESALRKTTQRVNLFSRVLIPQAHTNIRRIRLYLDDQDREGVVRAKLAKNKANGGTRV